MVHYFDLNRSSTPVWIWNIDAPVGLGRSNRPADVVLVQLLLNQSIRTFDLRDDRKPFEKREENPVLGTIHGYPPLDFLKVDGVCGPNTRYAISRYQKAACTGEGGIVIPLAKPDPEPRDMIFRLNVEALRVMRRMFPEETFPPIVTADLKRPATRR